MHPFQYIFVKYLYELPLLRVIIHVHILYRYFITFPLLTLARFLPVFMRARGFERRSVYAPIRLRLLFPLPVRFSTFSFLFISTSIQRTPSKASTNDRKTSFHRQHETQCVDYWRWDREAARKCKIDRNAQRYKICIKRKA